MSHDMRFPTMWYVRPAKTQISLHIRAVRSEPLLVAWIFYNCLATDWTSFGVSKLKRRLHRLVWVYTCQNATLLEITCHGSYVDSKPFCPGYYYKTSSALPIGVQRTSDSLNEGLPIKMTREKFKKNNVFSMKKIKGSTLDLSTKAVFSLDKYQLKNMGWKLRFCYSIYRK